MLQYSSFHSKELLAPNRPFIDLSTERNHSNGANVCHVDLIDEYQNKITEISAEKTPRSSSKIKKKTKQVPTFKRVEK
jgi:hypothetical protein